MVGVVGVVVRLLAGAAGDQTVFGTPLGMPWSNETVVWVLAPLLAAALVFVAAGAPLVRKLAMVEPDEVLRDLVR